MEQTRGWDHYSERRRVYVGGCRKHTDVTCRHSKGYLAVRSSSAKQTWMQLTSRAERQSIIVSTGVFTKEDLHAIVGDLDEEGLWRLWRLWTNSPDY